jgi:hypothetical protein
MTASRDETGHRSQAAPGAAGWLGVAAAPTFAVMTLLTCGPTGGADMMCSAAHGASPLSGMVPMYVLMSAFHATPRLKLIACRRSAARRTSQVGLDHRQPWEIGPTWLRRRTQPRAMRPPADAPCRRPAPRACRQSP